MQTHNYAWHLDYSFFTVTLKQEDVDRLLARCSQNGKDVEQISALQKQAAKDKDFVLAKAYGEQAKDLKSESKALAYIRQYVHSEYIGRCTPPSIELAPLVRSLDQQLFG